HRLFDGRNGGAMEVARRPTVVDDVRAVLRRIEDALGQRKYVAGNPTEAARRPEHLHRHDLGVRRDADNTNAVAILSCDGARDVRAVSLRIGNVGAFSIETPPIDVIDVAVAIVIDAVT